MPKVEGDELFRLVKAMEGYEKRSFKQHVKSRSTKEPSYLKLFNAIENQKLYDEQSLVKELGLKNKHQLHKEKYILQELILDNLRLQNTDDIQHLLYEQQRNIEILISKGLFKLPGKKLKVAKSNALAYEAFLNYLALLKLEYELYRSQSFPGITQEYLNVLKSEFRSAIDLYLNFNTCLFELSKVQVSIYRNSLTSDMQANDFFKSNLESRFLKDGGNARSVRAKYYFLFTKVLCHSRLNQPEKVYPYLHELSTLMDKHPIQMKQQPMAEIGIWNNLAINQLSLKKFEEVVETIDKLKQLEKGGQLQKRIVFYLSNLLELNLYSATGDFNNGERLMDSIEGRCKSILDRQQMRNFRYYFAYILFGQYKFAEANEEIELLLREGSDYRVDIQSFARIIQLMSYFEQGKTDLLEYSVRSTYRFLYKRKRLFKMEETLLRFIRLKMPNLQTEKEIKQGFTHLYDALQEAMDSPFERSALNYLDIPAWLQSKIKGIGFADAIKEELKKGTKDS